MVNNTASNLEDLMNNRLRKHVAAIHTGGNLTLLDRKMINVLLLNAYDDLLTRRTHTLPVEHLRAMIGWEKSYNVILLKKVLRKLATTPIEFNVMEDGEETWRVMTIISFGEIKGGICSYRYDEYLTERLYDPAIYAMINLGVQRRFEGGYALALYENCLRYKAVGSTGWWELSRFRKLMGALTKVYDEFKYLKRDVIVKSVKEINKVSDILLDVEYQKQGRKIGYVKFTVKDNLQRSLLDPKLLDGYKDVRRSEIYERLRNHGIGDRLAVAWVLQDEEHAQAVVDYVEEKDKKKLITGTTAGYIRKLIEDHAEVGLTTYQANKEKISKEDFEKEKQKKIDEKKLELEAEYKKQIVTERIKNLSVEDINNLVKLYNEEDSKNKIKSYSYKTGEFKDSIERMLFIGWLRTKIGSKVVLKKTEFAQWLKKKEKPAVTV